MVRHTPRSLIPRSARVQCVIGLLLALAGIATMVGCGTPRERYRVLSFFFDGVPDPDAPKAGPVNAGQSRVVTAVIITRHKPYEENRCEMCHRSASGNIMEFSEAYKQCYKCHKNVPTERPLMHGPVALSACQWCHAPHESAEPALLKNTPIKVCTQCHDQQLLGNKPLQHLDGMTSCLACHYGHGGDARYFLKPATRPASRPATAPGAQPATGPAGAAAPETQAAAGPSGAAPPATLEAAPAGKERSP